MERKIVQHGPATLMISLPAKWVRKKGLKKGDELNIEEKENQLIMGLDAKKHKSETSINISSFEESSIRTILTNVYRLGYDKITINYKDEAAIKIINEITEKNLLGFEITEKANGNCKIESITEPSIEQFDNIFSKVFMNIDDLFLIGENLFLGKKQEFEDIDRKIQQLDNFCKRVLIKNSLFENNFLHWSFHSSLIHASRELYHLFKYISRVNFKASKQELDLFFDVKEIFEIIKESYAKKDLALLEKVHKLEKELTYKKGYNALKKSDPIIIHHLLTSARHFYLTNSPLIGILIKN
ncbi:MAG: AbrB/MazE/SpoVT family DNA-binding domain-containing protein [Candidatus Pacearchaeota archaeon]|jgi:phosphate uptake regulator